MRRDILWAFLLLSLWVSYVRRVFLGFDPFGLFRRVLGNTLRRNACGPVILGIVGIHRLYAPGIIPVFPLFYLGSFPLYSFVFLYP